MSTRGNSNSCNHEYRKGDVIEVLRYADDADVPVWFPATVIDSPSPEGTLHVKFNTLYMERDGEERRRKRKKIRDYVNVPDEVTRPVPPPDPHRCFVIGEEVEVFHEKGWRRGEVKDVSENSTYMVAIGGVLQVVVEKRRVRVFRDWKEDDGSCAPSPLDQHQEKSPQLDLRSKKGTKLRIICSCRKEPKFRDGTRVEVTSDEEGYHGCWYAATVVGSVVEGKLLVQYDTLTTDDEMRPLVETADASNLRPLPPVINRLYRFNMLEEVDAWYNDGWWVGLLSKVLAGMKYAVYFWTTNEELVFDHSELRPHQELIDQKWVASFLRPKLAANPRLEKVKIRTGGGTLMAGLLRGLKVEIAHGERGYVSTWYPAVILGPVQNGKYLVEYQTLKTDDGRKPVKEEVDVLSIRPGAPIIQRADQFQPNDRVDAWDVNGWRSGEICRSVKNSKYAVYLWATNTVVQFWHAYLRPHQDFVDGVWSLPAKETLLT